MPAANTPYKHITFFDHQETLDADIERRRAFAERMEQEAAPSPLRERLKEQGMI